MKMFCLSLLLVGAVSVSAFRVKSVSPSQVKVKQGGSFKVMCTTDNWYEVRKSNVSIIFFKHLKYFLVSCFFNCFLDVFRSDGLI